MRLWRSGSALGFFMNARSSPSRRPRRPHMGSLLADQQDKQSSSYQQSKQNTDDERNNRMPTRLDLFRSSAFLCGSYTQPEEKFVHRPKPLTLRRQAGAIVFGPTMLLCGDATQQVLLPKSRVRKMTIGAIRLYKTE